MATEYQNFTTHLTTRKIQFRMLTAEEYVQLQEHSEYDLNQPLIVGYLAISKPRIITLY